MCPPDFPSVGRGEPASPYEARTPESQAQASNHPRPQAREATGALGDLPVRDPSTPRVSVPAAGTANAQDVPADRLAAAYGLMREGCSLHEAATRRGIANEAGMKALGELWAQRGAKNREPAHATPVQIANAHFMMTQGASLDAAARAHGVRHPEDSEALRKMAEQRGAPKGPAA